MPEGTPGSTPTPNAAQTGSQGPSQGTPQGTPQGQPKPGGPTPTQIATHRAADGKFTRPGEQAAEQEAKAILNGQQPPAPGQVDPAAPVEPPKPKIKIKVKGQEQELDYEDAVARLEMGEGYKRKFSELGQQQQQIERIAQALQTDPETAMRALGVDPEKWAVQILNRATQMQAMTPQQRQLYEQQTALERRAQEIAQYEQHLAMQAQQQKEAADLQAINELLPGALDTFGFKRDPFVIEQFAGEMEMMLAAGRPIDQTTVNLAMQTVHRRAVETSHQMGDRLDGQAYIDWLGPKGVKKVEDYLLQKYQQRKGMQQQKIPSGNTYAAKGERKMLTEQEYLELQKKRVL